MTTLAVELLRPTFFAALQILSLFSNTSRIRFFLSWMGRNVPRVLFCYRVVSIDCPSTPRPRNCCLPFSSSINEKYYILDAISPLLNSIPTFYKPVAANLNPLSLLPAPTHSRLALSAVLDSSGIYNRHPISGRQSPKFHRIVRPSKSSLLTLANAAFLCSCAIFRRGWMLGCY
jgi:hypothetical protein